VRSFLLAAQFLTVLPFPGPAEPRPAEFGRAVAYFPLVGLLVGLVLAGIDAAARLVWSGAVAAALVLLIGLLVTGALHFDGLLDTCDGIFLWQPERRLEAMRDSRVGGFGVAGGVAVYVLKFAALASLTGAGRVAALILAPVLGRAAVALALVALPYVRPAGLGNAFKDNVRPVHAIAAAAIALALAVAFAPHGAIALAAAAAVALALGRWIASRIGGMTGDTYGFLEELVETATYLAVAAVPWRASWITSWIGMPST
jgi:adenosylcobinamide-GDP ribazoletransferase